jgi:uncharacterized protein YndB with AHSA1/START domain
MAIKSNAAGAAGLVNKPSLTLKRRLNAPPAKVYAAWTNPKKMTRWFAPSSVKPGSEQASIDARVGGRYRLSFSKEDGEYYEVGGVYREVVPNQRLVFSWAWHSTPERESLVTVTLKPDGGGTLLTLHHEQLFDQAARDSHEQGWTGMLDNLERHLA